MSSIFGIIAKKDGKLVTKEPLYAEEESRHPLAHIFPPTCDYVQNILSKSNISDARKKWLVLDEEEYKSLYFNRVFDTADSEINYRYSMNEEIPKNFKAIKLLYGRIPGELDYSNEYAAYENWSKPDLLLAGLYKMKEILYEDLKQVIQRGEEDYFDKSSYDNINRLIISITTLTKITKVDEVALIYHAF